MNSNQLSLNAWHLVEDEAIEHDEEARLVERAKVDREARGELYRKHYPAIYRFVHRRIGNSHDAEELCQKCSWPWSRIFINFNIVVLLFVPGYIGWPSRR